MKKYTLDNIKAGIYSLVIFGAMFFVLFILQTKTSISAIEHKELFIILIPLTIISLPLIILIAFLGFLINPLMGYETLLLSLQGKITILILGIIYYFFLGIFIRLISKNYTN